MKRGIACCWRLLHDWPNNAAQLPSRRDERWGRHVVLKVTTLLPYHTLSVENIPGNRP